jgi:hypothetical protein
MIFEMVLDLMVGFVGWMLEKLPEVEPIMEFRATDAKGFLHGQQGLGQPIVYLFYVGRLLFDVQVMTLAVTMVLGSTVVFFVRLPLKGFLGRG